MNSPRPSPWFEDPVEVDRFLEGQLDAEARAHRERDAARDPALAERLAARRRFLDGLAAAGAAWRAGAHACVPADLESRVRFALRRAAAPPPASRLRWVAAAAAVLIGAVGMSFLGGRGGNADAMPPEVLHAADAARASRDGPRSCEVEGDRGPMKFPPVKNGSLRVWRCRDSDGRTVAKLYRPEDLPSIGYAAVAAEGVERGPDIGRTDLGDVVVFDLVYGRRRHYLAVSKGWLREADAQTPDRASCRACHNRSREGQPNPHNIVQRSWRLGG